MKKIAVVYSSKCGHTKQYAEWLKDDLDADVIAVGSFNFTRMLEYKLVVFACGVYGDKLSIMDNIKKNLSAVPAQKTMVMAVGWYTNDSDEAKKKLIADNFPEQFKNTVPLFVVNSGIDKKQISAPDKMKLVAAQLAIERKDGRSSDDINALAIIKGYSDQTSKDNLASIKKGIEDFFNPVKKEPEFPASKPSPAVPAAAAKPAPAPKSAKPSSAVDNLSDSVEEAFKNLGAPKPKPKPAAPKPETEETSAPVARFKENGEIVVSSIVEAINSLGGESAKPSPKPVVKEVKPEPVAEEIKPEPVAEEIKPELVAEEVKPEPVAEEVKPEPVAEEIKPEPVAEEVKPKPVAEEVKPEPRKNSYMEMFAKRRRNTAAETPAAPKTEPAPIANPAPAAAAAAAPESAPTAKSIPEKPIISEQSITDFDFADFVLEEKTTDYVSAPTNGSIGDVDLEEDVYDFIEDKKPTVSKRALNAVQDLAKAKAEAEKEAAKKEAARQAQLLEDSEDESSSNEIIEKMKHDIETLAEESEINIERGEPAAEDEDDGLEAFAFTDSADYDIEAEFAEPDEPELDTASKETKTDLDIRKLQEEINASIETNRAAKEKMMERYGKKAKEEVHNPFAVQFDDEDDAKKGKKKKQAPEPKRLADPIDPDIFFSKPGKKSQSMIPGAMPEIKFRNQK